MRRTNSKQTNGTFTSPQLIIEQQATRKLAEQIKAKLQLEQEKEQAKREAEEKVKEKEKEKKRKAKEKEEEKKRKAKEKEKEKKRKAKEKEKEKKRKAKEKEKEKKRKAKKKVWKPLSLFTKKGGITARRISANREFFYNKTADEIEIELQKMEYDTHIRVSNHTNSSAEIIEIKNHNKVRNIMQVQVTLDPNNWHKVPYVKISTNGIGKFKIVNGTKKEYNGLINEKAKIFFKRKRNKRRRKK